MSRASDEVGSEGMLPNYTPISMIGMPWHASMVFGTAMFAAGSWVGMIAAGYVGGTKNAPDWVLWAAAVVFLAGGALIIGYGVADLMKRTRGKRDALLHPDEGWRADYVWMDADSLPGMKSRDSGRWGMHAMGLLMVGCFTAISTWVSMTVPRTGIHFFLWTMTGVMYLVQLVVVIWIVKMVLRAIRYGTPRVVFESMPVRSGGMVTGTVMCPRGFRMLDRISITLRYVVESFEHVSNQNSKKQIVCRGKVHDSWVIDDVSAQLGGFGTEGQIPIAFLIPEDAEDTNASDRPARFWDLEVRGEAKGVDFVHRFAVPVYSEM